jgi:hypothetical protein
LPECRKNIEVVLIIDSLRPNCIALRITIGAKAQTIRSSRLVKVGVYAGSLLINETLTDSHHESFPRQDHKGDIEAGPVNT